MDFLSRLDIINEDVSDFIGFYNTHIGFDLHGERIGCGLSDEVSGKLIFNVGMIHLDQEVAKLTVNIRYPVTLDDETVYDSMMPYLDKYDLGVVKLNHQAHYIPVDDPLIVTLMDMYQHRR